MMPYRIADAYIQCWMHFFDLNVSQKERPFDNYFMKIKINGIIMRFD